MELFNVVYKAEVKKIEDLDPFFNVRPKEPSGSSRKFAGSLDSIEKNKGTSKKLAGRSDSIKKIQGLRGNWLEVDIQAT